MLAGLTRLIRSLALMTLIKNLGRHTVVRLAGRGTSSTALAALLNLLNRFVCSLAARRAFLCLKPRWRVPMSGATVRRLLATVALSYTRGDQRPRFIGPRVKNCPHTSQPKRSLTFLLNRPCSF
jgi:hypothetical protein